MKEVLDELDTWLNKGDDVAMATLVATRGSSPRMPGARLVLTRDGGMAGSVSGGCVETDVYEHALEVLDTGRPELVSYGIADDVAFEVGLSCGGSIDVLVEPFHPDPAWTATREAVDRGEPVALAIALTPDSLAARRLAVTRSDAHGSISPAVDTRLAALARDLLDDDQARVIDVESDDGPAQVFVQAFAPAPHMIIVGATHAAMPLSRMAKEVGFRVTVADARGLFATKERFPEADDVIRAWPQDAFARISLDRYSYVVILSHDSRFDLPTLEVALKSPARYIGAMGSSATHGQRLDRLREMGFTDEQLARIHSPIGLSIQARTPEEIAVSILAEVVLARRSPVRIPVTA